MKIKGDLKKKVLFAILVIFLIAVIGFIFNIYFYGAAKEKYCVTQTRQQFPEIKGSPSAEWFIYYDECLDNLTATQSFRLMFSSF